MTGMVNMSFLQIWQIFTISRTLHLLLKIFQPEVPGWAQSFGSVGSGRGEVADRTSKATDQNRDLTIGGFTRVLVAA